MTGPAPVMVALEQMTLAELNAEAERQRAGGDDLHAAELEFYAGHFFGKPLPSQDQWRAACRRAFAAGDPTAVRLVALHRRAP